MQQGVGILSYLIVTFPNAIRLIELSVRSMKCGIQQLSGKRRGAAGKEQEREEEQRCCNDGRIGGACTAATMTTTMIAMISMIGQWEEKGRKRVGVGRTGDVKEAHVRRHLHNLPAGDVLLVLYIECLF